MELYKHQQKVVDDNPRSCGLWFATGTGKSHTLMALAEKNNVSLLLICPKSIKYKWQEDIKENIPNINATIMTKEEFRRDWKKIPYHQAFVIDEVHHHSNPKSQLHKTAKAWLKKHRPRYVWLSSATPYRSTPWNVYALCVLLGKPLNWKKFQQDFFTPQYMGHRVIHVPDESKNKTLQEILRIVGYIVRLEDCIDMPEAVFEYETVPLTFEQKKAIDELDEEVPIVRYSKMHQIENGTLKGNEINDDEIYNGNKIDRIIDIAETVPKLAVFAKYNLQVKQIAKTLEDEGYTVFTLTGQTKNEAEIIEKAEQTDNCIIVINAEKAEGYELPSFRHIVYASLPFSLVAWEQSRGRFRRINNPQRVSFIVLTSDGEVDPAVKRSLEKKEDFQLDLFIQNKL